MTQEEAHSEHSEHAIPALYEGPMPFLPCQVPPDDVSLWTDEDKRFYEEWQKWVSKGSKKRFRKFLSQVNNEHREIFELIADGVWGLRRLQAYTQKFPCYNLEKDLEYYNNEENDAVIEIVKCGLELVRAEQLRCGLEVDFDEQQPKSVPRQLPHEPARDCHTEPDEDSNTVPGKTDVKTDNDETMEIKTDTADKLSQLYSNTPMVKARKAQQKTRNRGKRTRHERLLLFQEKLVKTSGLPPSRLMKQRLDQIGLITVKKSLAGEFEQLASLTPAHTSVSVLGVDGHVPPLAPMPGEPVPLPPVPLSGLSVPPPSSPVLMPVLSDYMFPPSALMPGQVAPTVPMPGQHYPPPILMPGQTAPLQYGFSQCQAQPQTLTSSGFNSLPTLCSSPVTFGANETNSVGVPQFPPILLGLRPAYCFHCLQFGSVFMINQV